MLSNQLGRPGWAVPCIAVCLALSGCDSEPKDRTVGWLKLTLDTAYKGKPVHFVEYAECFTSHVPGGSFGATPSLKTIAMRPKSFGQNMPDGTYIAFRAPELCRGYFAKGAGAQNWGSAPTPFVPLMTWADRQRRPSMFEAYVAQEAFNSAGSKFSLPTAIAEPMASVSSEIKASAAGRQNVILQDSWIISPEDELGYRRGERGFRSVFGWQTENFPDQSNEEYRTASDCLSKVRTGQLVPDRQVQGDLTLESCKISLARLVPFTWDGKQYNAEPSRVGTLIFQRIPAGINNASYFVGHDIVRKDGVSIDMSRSKKYYITSVSAPVRDPDLGASTRT